jgi:HlyD family secretion protein
MARSTALPLPKSGTPVWLRVAAGALLLLALLAALTYAGVFPRVRRAIFGNPTVTFQTTTVSRGHVALSVTATGPIATISSLPLTFKTSGKLADLKVYVGDKVAKGQVLATLDTTDLKIALDQTKAQLATAKAGLAKVQSGATDSQRSIAQTSVDNAKQAVSDAQSGLGVAQSSSAKDVASAQTAVSAAGTGLAAARDALAAAQAQESKALAADQTSVTNAQKNLDGIKATVAANVPVLQQSVEAAKDNLWAAQTKRDFNCTQEGQSCESQNALVGTAQTQLNQAQAQMDASQKQGAQQIASAQSQLDQAQAQLLSDKAKLDAAVVTAQNQVKQAQAAVSTAQASLGQAEARATATAQQGQSQINQASSAVKAAQANFDQVVAPAASNDLDAAQAQVASAEAAVEEAQANLDSATLVAPFDGTVATVNGTVGQWITGGPTTSANAANVLFTLVDLDKLQVTAQVNEADIGKVKAGDPVSFIVSAFPDKTFNGKVLQIQPVGTVVQNVVNYNVTSSIQQASGDAVLYPGMTATVNIISADHQDVVLVPNSALSFAQDAIDQGLTTGNRGARAANRQATPAAKTTATPVADAATKDAEGTTVLVLESGRPVPVQVTLGISDGTNTEVISGLNPGQAVVVGLSGGNRSASSTSGGPNGGNRPGAGILFR